LQKQIIKLEGELNTEREKNINITTKENTELKIKLLSYMIRFQKIKKRLKF